MSFTLQENWIVVNNAAFKKIKNYGVFVLLTQTKTNNLLKNKRFNPFKGNKAQLFARQNFTRFSTVCRWQY
jgi:hypothetical protein